MLQRTARPVSFSTMARLSLIHIWNWIAAPPAVGQPLPCTARTRYHQPERPATATLLPDGRVRVDFAAPQRAIADVYKRQALWALWQRRC